MVTYYWKLTIMLTKISVLIVDDESSARSNMINMLNSHCPSAEILGETESVQEAQVLLETLKPDILFLDVQLQDGTGFDLLDRVSRIDFNAIFTTAFDEFAIKAFRYNAVDYLLKPIDPEELVSAFHKASQRINQNDIEKQMSNLIKSTSENNFDRIVLPTSDGMVFVHTGDIVRLESCGNYSFVFLKNGERILTSQNLKLFEEILPETIFCRVHQSFIINTTFLKKIIRDNGDFVEMNDATKVPIARRRKDDLVKLAKGHSATL
jgi:two-component system LytT family response regulator